jgi:hypothetical protein
MDENKLVVVKAAVLAEAAKLPLGSLHSLLGSLEKKQLISDRGLEAPHERPPSTRFCDRFCCAPTVASEPSGEQKRAATPGVRLTV